MSSAPEKKVFKSIDTVVPDLPEWDVQNRPEPPVNGEIWRNPAEAAHLKLYIDWHRRHPHCESPRPLVIAKDKLSHKSAVDEENPNMCYSIYDVKLAPIPKEFYPPEIGLDGDIDEVSTIAMNLEYDSQIDYRRSYEDPWYMMSVKDSLETSHIDGTYTTVKRKGPKKKRLTEFEKNQKQQRANFSEYSGGGPPVSDEHVERLENLALQDKFELFVNKKPVKVGPWERPKAWSKYTAKGTALNAYKALELKRNVESAVKAYERDCAKSEKEQAKQRVQRTNDDDEVSVMPAAVDDTGTATDTERFVTSLTTITTKPVSTSSLSKSTGEVVGSSSRKGARSKKSRGAARRIAPDPDEFDVMKKQLGGEVALEKMTMKWIKEAKYVAKKAKIQKAELDVTVDLEEACDKMRVIKATTLLATGMANANDKNRDDEPLFIALIQKLLKLDSLSGYLLTSDKGSKTDAPDRKRVQLILAAFAQFEVNINTLEAKDGCGAVHLAAKAGNGRVLSWLKSWDADMNLLSTNERMTAMMFAAKYGHVLCLAELIGLGVDFNLSARDIKPLNSLPSINTSPSKNLANLAQSAGFGHFTEVAKPVEGRTPLHYAAAFGQTRAAEFLLRVGANKKPLDDNGRNAAMLAMDHKFSATGQQISAYAVLQPPVSKQLEFLVMQDEKRLEKLKRKGLLGGLFGAAEDLKKGLQLLCKALSYPVTALVNCLLPGRRGKKELAELKAEEALNLAEGDSDDEDSVASEGEGTEVMPSHGDPFANTSVSSKKRKPFGGAATDTQGFVIDEPRMTLDEFDEDEKEDL